MKTLGVGGKITEELSGVTLGQVIDFFISCGNIQLKHEDAMFFIDAMKKYHKKVKIKMAQADEPDMVKFVKE